MNTDGAGFADGARAGLPVVFGYLGIGAAAGVVERAAGLSYAEILLLSMVLYAGSAQFVLTSMVVLVVAMVAVAPRVMANSALWVGLEWIMCGEFLLLALWFVMRHEELG